MTQLAPRRYKHEAEFERTIHVIIPEFGTPIEAMLDPGYWAHVSNFLRPFDRIEVNAEDGSYFAELIVKSAGKLYANVELLRHVPLAAVTPGAIENVPSGYNVKYRGSLDKWCITRDDVAQDGKVTVGKDVLKTGYDTEAEARTWLLGHLKTVPPVKLPAKAAGAKADTSL